MSEELTSIVLFLTALAAVAARYTKLAEPFYNKLPPNLQWLPSAIFAVAAILSGALPSTDTWPELGDAIAQSVVAVLLAMQAGAHALPASKTETE